MSILVLAPCKILLEIYNSFTPTVDGRLPNLCSSANQWCCRVAIGVSGNTFASTLLYLSVQQKFYLKFLMLTNCVL